MKCRMAVFEDVPVHITPTGAVSEITERKPVECGGEIKEDKYGHVVGGVHLGGGYCTKCGVRYEKLPEELEE